MGVSVEISVEIQIGFRSCVGCSFAVVALCGWCACRCLCGWCGLVSVGVGGMACEYCCVYRCPPVTILFLQKGF
jgi:hypothetical protein